MTIKKRETYRSNIHSYACVCILVMGSNKATNGQNGDGQVFPRAETRQRTKNQKRDGDIRETGIRDIKTVITELSTEMTTTSGNVARKPNSGTALLISTADQKIPKTSNKQETETCRR